MEPVPAVLDDQAFVSIRGPAADIPDLARLQRPGGCAWSSYSTVTRPRRGLQGLADRLAALGGRLRVDSTTGGGTRVRAVLPCG
ncbi:hypothetical protein [Streptomyces sp. HUAS ZL42]|uniref:hypothetical protein n=1 Tax=Streptomyces sp. HUAS ZL42 TaxID=3231715 RepID=UPI00345F027A